jgi:hypothetical protein
MEVVDFEMLPWEMDERHLLCGEAPINLLLDSGATVLVKAGLGPGYWRRIHDELNKLNIKPGVLPHADGTINWQH